MVALANPVITADVATQIGRAPTVLPTEAPASERPGAQTSAPATIDQVMRETGAASVTLHLVSHLTTRSFELHRVAEDVAARYNRTAKFQDSRKRPGFARAFIPLVGGELILDWAPSAEEIALAKDVTAKVPGAQEKLARLQRR